jgi:hypothetical protein
MIYKMIPSILEASCESCPTCVVKKMSTAHDVRAQSRKEESDYKSAILAAASHAAALCIAGAEIVVFHIVFILANAIV